MIFIKLFVILYADDTILLSDNAKQFQETLNIFYEYCKNWKLNINIEKTKIMILVIIAEHVLYLLHSGSRNRKSKVF